MASITSRIDALIAAVEALTAVLQAISDDQLPAALDTGSLKVKEQGP